MIPVRTNLSRLYRDWVHYIPVGGLEFDAIPETDRVTLYTLCGLGLVEASLKRFTGAIKKECPNCKARSEALEAAVSLLTGKHVFEDGTLEAMDALARVFLEWRN